MLVFLKIFMVAGVLHSSRTLYTCWLLNWNFSLEQPKKLRGSLTSALLVNGYSTMHDGIKELCVSVHQQTSTEVYTCPAQVQSETILCKRVATPEHYASSLL